MLHWDAVAYRYHDDQFQSFTPRLVDSGVIEVNSSSLGLEKAIRNALEELNDLCLAGWASRDTSIDGDALILRPVLFGADSGYQPEVVYEFCRDYGGVQSGYIPIKGHGESEDRVKTRYRSPEKSTKVRVVGKEFHIAQLKAQRTLLFETNSDYWKTEVHDRFAQPANEIGAFQLFQDDPNEHRTFCRHILAEKLSEEWDPKRGLLRKWHKTGKHNHHLDCLHMNLALAQYHGMRSVRTMTETPRQKAERLHEEQKSPPPPASKRALPTASRRFRKIGD
jgi:hypothetical protein